MKIETENPRTKAREKLQDLFMSLNTSRVAAFEHNENGNWWFPFILEENLVDEAVHSMI